MIHTFGLVYQLRGSEDGISDSDYALVKTKELAEQWVEKAPGFRSFEPKFLQITIHDSLATLP